MIPASYPDLVASLFPRLTGGIRWGLDRTERILAAAGNPHHRFRSLHIGGTNGKGSVAATVESVLRRAGHRTGLYTSPHLCTFRERIRIDGRPIEEDALMFAARRIWPAVEKESPSFFEATTALAFLALADANVDVAVVEVGLGGRLDATNVIRPEVAVVTNVALDHVQFLGPTLDSVAREKAGIFKPGVPALTGATEPEVLAVLRAAARNVEAEFHVMAPDDLMLVGTTVHGTGFRLRTDLGELSLHTPLVGSHQGTNAALAVRALRLLPADLRPDRAALEDGVAGVRWAGRLQIERVRDRTWVFDVAHNVAGVQALASALETLPLAHPRVLLIGVLGDKDWRNMLRPLFAAADGAILTRPPTAPPERAWDPVAVLVEVPDPKVEAIASFDAALERAAVLAGPGGTVIVTGSFHTVGDALALLGRAPDGIDPGLPVSPIPA